MRSANGGGLLGDKHDESGTREMEHAWDAEHSSTGVRKEGCCEHWRGRREQGLQGSAVKRDVMSMQVSHRSKTSSTIKP